MTIGPWCTVALFNWAQKSSSSLSFKCCDSSILRQNPRLISWKSVRNVARERVRVRVRRGRGAEGGNAYKGHPQHYLAAVTAPFQREENRLHDTNLPTKGAELYMDAVVLKESSGLSPGGSRIFIHPHLPFWGVTLRCSFSISGVSANANNHFSILQLFNNVPSVSALTNQRTSRPSRTLASL